MTDRIKSIADSATSLFLQQGYSKTQISHIAKAVGVSVGTIYLDCTGKKEIMHFILKCTLDSNFINREFSKPITDDLFASLENDIVEMFEQTGNDLTRHLASHAEDYNLEALVSDVFDMMSKYAVIFLFIEKNQFDFKFLAEHYKQYRKRFIEVMTQYMTEFIEQGTVRPLENLELTTALIIEILSWWAMDARYISFEKQDIPLDITKKICMDNIISAYQRKN